MEPLSIALRDSHPDVREAAVEALGNLEDPRAADALQMALKDQNERVRQRAKAALEDIEDRDDDGGDEDN